MTLTLKEKKELALNFFNRVKKNSINSQYDSFGTYNKVVSLKDCNESMKTFEEPVTQKIISTKTGQKYELTTEVIFSAVWIRLIKI